MRCRWAAIGGAVALLASATAGPAGPASASAARPPAVITVPGGAPTIQAAVDAASPGTLILVAPGVHHEAVTVGRGHPDLVIRGVDRNASIVDCGFDEDPNRSDGFKVLADGVAVENLTVRDCTSNGVLWQGVTGYRGSYLTAVRNGDYGIYAFNSTHGTWDHDFAMGSPDAGFYIGQCYPCHAVITDVESQWNGLGYSGTNSGGDLTIVRSRFHDNRSGIVPNSGSEELNPPERATTIVGNAVYGNHNEQTAAIDIAATATGTGILLAGGDRNLVARNLVYDHPLAGIGVVPLPEQLLSPGPHAQNFDARQNRVIGNVVRASNYDLVLISTINSASDAGGNCFSANRHGTSLPADLEQVAPCTGRPTGTFRADLARFGSLILAAHATPPDYRAVALPPVPTLPGLSNPRHAPTRPATHEPARPVNAATVGVPAAPTSG
jgi:hypothetical protein